MRPLSFSSRRVLFLLSSIHPFLLGWLRASEMKTPFPHYCRGLAVEIRFLKSSPWNKAAGRGERARACGQRAQKNKEAPPPNILCSNDPESVFHLVVIVECAGKKRKPPYAAAAPSRPAHRDKISFHETQSRPLREIILPPCYLYDAIYIWTRLLSLQPRLVSLSRWTSAHMQSC